MAIWDNLPDVNLNDFAFDIPGYDLDTKDLIIFALAIGKILLLILFIMACKARRRSASKLHLKWV
ncbi:TPA_asm: P6 [Artemisia alphacytorhabdovirus 2]|nr:TPA_asm: P6 [Artemisia alphacytorhabdovirus 2]